MRQDCGMATESQLVSLSPNDQDELKALVIAAFERARAAGIANWKTMSAAVLKNRLLDVSGGQFDETKYGASRFAELLRALPELLDVDWESRPARATLLAELSASARIEAGPRRIRDDLWRAVYDFSQGGAYVWSNGAAIWVPHADPDDLVLPTMSAEEFSELRTVFARESGATEAAEWAKTKKGTSGLPAGLRRSWNKALQENARRRLRPWFDEHGISTSADEVPPSGGPGDETERLRRFVQRCVSGMTFEELSSLLIPAAAASRTRR